jgi:hypothetical protein
LSYLRGLWQGSILSEPADCWLLKTTDLNFQQTEKIKGAGVKNWWLHLTAGGNSPKQNRETSWQNVQISEAPWR